jgi:hypothetical protein
MSGRPFLKARYEITALDTGRRTVALVTATGAAAPTPIKLRHNELLVGSPPPAGSRASASNSRRV